MVVSAERHNSRITFILSIDVKEKSIEFNKTKTRLETYIIVDVCGILFGERCRCVIPTETNWSGFELGSKPGFQMLTLKSVRKSPLGKSLNKISQLHNFNLYQFMSTLRISIEKLKQKRGSEKLSVYPSVTATRFIRTNIFILIMIVITPHPPEFFRCLL